MDNKKQTKLYILRRLYSGGGSCDWEVEGVFSTRKAAEDLITNPDEEDIIPIILDESDPEKAIIEN